MTWWTNHRGVAIHVLTAVSFRESHPGCDWVILPTNVFIQKLKVKKPFWGWLIDSTLLYATRCTFQIGRISAYVPYIALLCVYCVRLGGPITGGCHPYSNCNFLSGITSRI